MQGTAPKIKTTTATQTSRSTSTVPILRKNRIRGRSMTRKGTSPIASWGAALLTAIFLSLGVCVAQAQAVPADATVAPNGDGQFKSIQDAINAAPQKTSRDRPWVIHIKPGVYKELIYIQREKRFITLEGEDPAKTILTYNLNANMLGQD